jgi:nucleoside-diphosphate-sugar epimerase
MKRVLIVGNLGYIGPQTVHTFRNNGWEAHGLDSGMFGNIANNDLNPTSDGQSVQHYCDVRHLSSLDLQGYDSIVYLAAISNDPIGNEFENVTYDVNYEACVELAKKAIQSKVNSFVFASSCSIYGSAGDIPRSEGDVTAPITAYAKSKIFAENALLNLQGNGMRINILRFATACGPSKNLRLDLVLNDFVASSILEHKINILSDGSPKRPLVDVRDMAEAIFYFSSSMELTKDAYTVNIGSNDWNFTVHELATLVADQIQDIDIVINPAASPDKRSYWVDFNLYKSLPNTPYPTRNISETIERLIEIIGTIKFETDFRSSRFIRLNKIRMMQNQSILDRELFVR